MAPASVSASTSQTAVGRALTALRQIIFNGEFAKGDKLPTEFELVRRLGTSRATVRNALLQLQNEGVISALAGNGRTRARVVAQPTGGGGLVARTIVLLAAGENSSKQDPRKLLGGRGEQALEVWTARVVQKFSRHLMLLGIADLRPVDVEQLIAMRPGGVLATEYALGEPEARSLLERAIQAGIPVVCSGSEATALGCDRVVSDHACGGYELTRWLLSRGRQRILQVGSAADGLAWVQERSRGYQKALSEAGLPALPRRHVPDLVKLSDEPGNHQMRTRHFAGFLAEYVHGPDAVDAIMAQNDWDAALVCGALRLLGREPNRQVLVTGYDNLWPFVGSGDERNFPAATADKDMARLASEMLTLLQDRAEGRLPAEPQMRTVRPTVVEVDEAAVEREMGRSRLVSK